MNDQQNHRRQLSSRGILRQSEMLKDLKAQLHRRTRQRQQRRTRLVLAAAAILLVASAWGWNRPADAPRVVVEKTGSISNEAADSIAPQFTHVSLEKINDNELLTALANLGQPSVLGQIGGETTVVSQVKP